MKTGKTLTELAVEIDRQAKSKKDYVADLSAVEMVAENDTPRLNVEGVGSFGIRPIAHGQIAEHVKIPRQYYDRMLEKDKDLLATNVTRWFRKYPAPQMFRMLDGENRAMLSPGYQPLDNYDFGAAALPILQKRNLRVMSCEITERRLYIKAVDEQLFKDVPVGFKLGDGSHRIFKTCAPVIILSNSEVGFGRMVVDHGVYEGGCTNMTFFTKAGLKRTHVGAKHRLVEGMDVAELESVMKNDTRQKMLEALWLQVRDVITSAFDEKAVTARFSAFEVAAGRAIKGPVDKVMDVTAERFSLTVGERDSIFDHLVKGGELSQYGLSAAITRAAQDVESYDRATELEYLGGRVIELPSTEWETLALAA